MIELEKLTEAELTRLNEEMERFIGVARELCDIGERLAKNENLTSDLSEELERATFATWCAHDTAVPYHFQLLAEGWHRYRDSQKKKDTAADCLEVDGRVRLMV